MIGKPGNRRPETEYGRPRTRKRKARKGPKRKRTRAVVSSFQGFPITSFPCVTIHGRVGNRVFKTYRDKIVVTRVPRFDGYKPSAAQRDRREKMRAATAFAQAVYANPTTKAVYLAAAKKLGRQAFRLAVSDFLHGRTRVTFEIGNRTAANPCPLSAVDSSGRGAPGRENDERSGFIQSPNCYHRSRPLEKQDLNLLNLTRAGAEPSRRGGLKSVCPRMGLLWRGWPLACFLPTYPDAQRVAGKRSSTRARFVLADTSPGWRRSASRK